MGNKGPISCQIGANGRAGTNSSCYRRAVKYTRYCWLLLTAWCLLAGAGLAQESPTSLSDIDAFKLWNECAPIELLVEGLSDDAADIDLTRERIQTLVESRLRVARLYDGAALLLFTPYLYVRVNVVVSEDLSFGAFNIAVFFHKILRDVVSDWNWFAVTWFTGAVGAHTGDADFILQAVSGQVDQFILEYLRVNETACQ